jgi:hypothetical protein
LYYGQYETPARIWNADATASSGTGTASPAPSGGTSAPAQVGGTAASLPPASDETSETTDGTTTDGTTATSTTATDTNKKDTEKDKEKDDTKPKWVIPAVVGGVLAVGAIAYFLMKKKSV